IPPTKHKVLSKNVTLIPFISSIPLITPLEPRISIAEVLPSLAQDENYSKLQFYNETYFLELLWQCVFDLKPIAPPNSLWFGILDIAQHLSQKTTQIVSLTLCYYLELFKDIVQEDIEKYQATLSTTSQQIFEKIIHDVTQKLQLSLQLVEQSSVTNFEEKLGIKGDRKLLNIIAEEVTCPITKQITGDFLILTCGHSISYYAINKWKKVITIENRPFECPFCKNEIELESTYNHPENKILEVEDDLFLKFNKYKIFKGSILSKSFTSIFQKVQPKIMLPAFNKAAKAEQQEDYEAVIMWFYNYIRKVIQFDVEEHLHLINLKCIQRLKMI
ncbi:41111_t:CDS:2, partial [Gigaspora margarita]